MGKTLYIVSLCISYACGLREPFKNVLAEFVR